MRRRNYAAPPLVGQMVDWTGSFQSSYLALAGFAFVTLLATFGIRKQLTGE